MNHPHKSLARPCRGARCAKNLARCALLFACLEDQVAPVHAQDRFAPPRLQMVEDIAADARRTGVVTGRPRISERVMQVISRVPRHEFVPKDQILHAYEDRPLPLGMQQTISQPFIVALSTDLIDPEPTDIVLEIGTGSGYQAAVLAGLVAHVYTIEIVEALGRQAAERLRLLGYGNVEARIGDGYQGWPEHAPYDAIMVTAAAPQIPQRLVDQLKPGGRMVIPIGSEAGIQELMLVRKGLDGKITMRSVLQVRFVPMTGER
jgi:protein-L-isoaspartate(D-aspartate) O-methyltransferase